MTIAPDQQNNPRDHATKNDAEDAASAQKRRSAPTDPDKKASGEKRKDECDALGERFPEQCDSPTSEDAPARVMPDEKKKDSAPDRNRR